MKTDTNEMFKYGWEFIKPHYNLLTIDVLLTEKSYIKMIILKWNKILQHFISLNIWNIFTDNGKYCSDNKKDCGKMLVIPKNLVVIVT